MYPKNLAAHFSCYLTAKKNSLANNNDKWYNVWSDVISKLRSSFLPSGSGIDSPIILDEGKSDSYKLVFLVPFHKMNENGYYDGWETFKVKVIASLDGIEVKVFGGKKDLRDYIGEVMYEALNQVIPKEVVDDFILEAADYEDANHAQ
jgi:hypothetical protein